VSFVKAMLGPILNQPALSSDVGGLTNPNFIDFTFALFRSFNIEKTTLVSSAIAFCGLILGVAITMLARKTGQMDDFAAVRIFEFGGRSRLRSNGLLYDIHCSRTPDPNLFCDPTGPYRNHGSSCTAADAGLACLSHSIFA
jgi:hypothetical protein